MKPILRSATAFTLVWLLTSCQGHMTRPGKVQGCSAGDYILLTYPQQCLDANTGRTKGDATAALAADGDHRAAGGSGDGPWPQPYLKLVGTLSVAGLSGRVETIQDVRSGHWLTRMDLGPFRQASGFDGAAWNADLSGVVNLDDDPGAAQAALDAAYRGRRGFMGAAYSSLATTTQAADARFDIMIVNPPSGRPAEIHVDRHTGLLKQWIEQGDGKRSQISYSDYRLVEGVWLPFEIRVGAKDTGSEQLTRVDRYEFLPRPGRLPPVRPRSTITDAELPGEVVRIPITIEGGHIVVPVSIGGGTPLPFILDSGAGANILSSAAAEALDVAASGSIAARGVGEKAASASFTRIPEFSVGPASLRDQSFVVLDLPPILSHRGPAPPIAGLLGYDFLRRFRVEIDYAASMLSLRPIARCSARLPAHAVPLGFRNKIPVVNARIDGATGLFAIDTGAASQLDIFSAFAMRHGLDEEGRLQTVAAGGVGGEVEGALSRLTQFEIGSHRIRRPYATIVRAERGAFASSELAGNIGSNILRQFKVGFDYECRRMSLARGGEFGLPEPINRAGFTFTVPVRGGPVHILHVQEAGPAAKAGLEAGSELLFINGIPVKTLSYGSIRDILSGPAGARVMLRVRQEGADREAALPLSDPLKRGRHG